jgi:3-deoxy-manno-octulosonate cytidylyltransferase (CMP-KDO synthetase)
MKALCVIPARYASSRLPGKPLLELNGRTLLGRVWDAVNAMDLFDKIIIATDDDRIMSYCRREGIDAIMTSPDHPSGTDRVAEVAMEMGQFDVVVNVQGDEPEVSKDMLAALLTLMNKGGVDIATPVVCAEPQALSDPNRVKVVLDVQDRALYFSRAGIPFPREEATPLEVLCHVGVYAFKRGPLLEVVGLPVGRLEQIEKLEQLRWLEAGYQIHCIKGHWRYGGIDTQDDARAYIEYLNSKEA